MKVLFFGVLSEIAEKPFEEMSFEGSILEFREMLNKQYPEFSDKKYQVAVNQKIAQDDHSLLGTEEIALLPPFTGG